MKKTILLIAFFVLSYSYSQNFDTFKNLYNDKNIVDIKSIKTLNDFDQKKLSEKEIDDKIKSFMTDSKIGNFDIPINYSKLKYHGKKNPKEIITFFEAGFDHDMSFVNKPLEIFSFDGVWIFVDNQEFKNIINVFFAARAIQILKFKYPEAYEYLLKPDQVKLGYDKLDSSQGKPPLNKMNPIISFDKSPTKIAGSLWNLKLASKPTLDYRGTKNYENTLNCLTSINYETVRPKEIYKKEDELSNYWLYLREGLIESITHEFIHHYVTNFKFFDMKGGFVFGKRNDSQDQSFQVDVEEAMVINTAETYLIRKGGLSDDLLNFNLGIKYQGKKEILQDLTIASNKARYDALKLLSPPTSDSFDYVYRFYFLD
ncbi:hypothetical protein D0817_10470 [Flavobacterium cupreum]|uniref:Uncharacterized protein n=1 Tax=Flavobacterium cupreum TaxID=2133766 RepID=A0A434A745_9FLAO|nr:hypothetical protein [Flavobacterium cupreum]RUT70238.1 hypothetical protein D0817_10470 [Flavobacterium cupreum]